MGEYYRRPPGAAQADYEASKHCPSCNTTKPISEWNKHSKRKDGLQAQCRACNKAHYSRTRQIVLEPGDPRHGTSQGYQQIGCSCEICVETAASNRRRLKWGFTKAQLQWFDSVDSCPICGNGFVEDVWAWRKCVDHCHETGEIRGVVHQGCNVRISVGSSTTERVAELFRSSGDVDIAEYLLGGNHG